MAERGTRADARSNRARIVEAARSLIDSSTELRLSTVAKAAGVGQGTMYRHFTSREELLAEVYRTDVEQLVSSTDELLSRHDPVTAFRHWFDRIAEYARVKRGVLAALETDTATTLTQRSTGSIGEAIGTLLDAGKADGSIRDDVDARDVLLLLSYLSRLDEDGAAERTRHTLDLVLDGIRTRD